MKMSKLTYLIEFVVLMSAISGSLSIRNRLIRVDGINPTCDQKPKCKEFEVAGAAISVDKSLPYMGSNMCCIKFKLMDEEFFYENNHNPEFMVRILNSTVLEGDDFITFFDGDTFDVVVKNVTATDSNPYEMLYFKYPTITIELYKDKQFRSTYEIAVAVFHRGDSPLCKTETYHRCGPTNTSICIDQELTCDKYSHCEDDSDETICGSLHETQLHYDTFIVKAVLLSIAVLIILAVVFIFLLCLCKTSNVLSGTFISIFGNKSEKRAHLRNYQWVDENDSDYNA